MVEKNVKNCRDGYQEMILDYVYQELDQIDLARFKGHLADCRHCSAEINELENVHFAVNEHVGFAFEPLLTPKIDLPINEKLSFAEKFAALFTSLKVQSAVGSFAALLVAVLVGYIYFAGQPTEEVAVQTEKNIERTRAAEIESSETVVDIEKNEKDAAAESKIAVIPVDLKANNKVSVPKRKRVSNSKTRVRPASDRIDQPAALEDLTFAEFEDRDEREQGLSLSELFDDEGV